MPDTEASQLAFQFTLLRLTNFVYVSNGRASKYWGSVESMQRINGDFMV